MTYSNNLVYGGAEDVYTAAVTDEAVVVADPKFVDVNDYTQGYRNAEEGLIVSRGTAYGFRLQKDSPAIDAGIAHPDAPNSQPSAVKNELVENTTAKPEYDYYGNKLTDGKNDIGANEYVEGGSIDKSVLEEVIKEAEAIDPDKYTKESYKVLNDTLIYVKAIYESDQATQSEIEQAVYALREAIDTLVEATEPDDTAREALKDLYNKYAGVEQGKYTEASYKAFKEALNAVKAVLDDADASDEELKAAYDKLAEAVNKLEVADEPGQEDAVRDALQKLYDKYKNLKQGKYTNSSYAAFTKALKDVKDVLANENATEAEMRTVYAALANAINNLTVQSSSSAISSGNSTTSQAVKTGDTAPIALYMAIAVFALFAASGAMAMKRRRRR